MSDQCQDCKAKDWRIEALTEDVQQLLARIKELEAALQTLCEYEIAVMKSSTEESERRLARLKDVLPANLPKMSLLETHRQLTERNNSKPSPDPWLGVWRAKRHTALDDITTKVAYLEPGTIIRVKGVKDGYVHIFFGREDFEWHTISWLQENFEKVEGEV